MSQTSEPLAIGGRLVERKLLESHTTQRCSISECHSWCCTGGVWVDLWERDKILAAAERVKPHLPPERQDEAGWFDGERDEHPDYPSGQGEGTSVVDDPTHPAGYTCVFLRPQDRRCALQVASVALGQHPWELKPFYCALHPITIEENVVRLDDTNEIYLEGGHCQRPHQEPVPLYVTFADELRLALGDDGYWDLRRLAEAPERLPPQSADRGRR